jgi:hypothetical protein
VVLESAGLDHQPALGVAVAEQAFGGADEDGNVGAGERALRLIRCGHGFSFPKRRIALNLSDTV